jgi:hypothetical protein
VGLGSAALVLNREWPPKALQTGERGRALDSPFAGTDPPQFHHVGLARKPETRAAEREAANDSEIAAGLVRSPVRPLVEMRSFHCQCVVHPNLFEVDQGSLPLAEE